MRKQCSLQESKLWSAIPPTELGKWRTGNPLKAICKSCFLWSYAFTSKNNNQIASFQVRMQEHPCSGQLSYYHLIFTWTTNTVVSEYTGLGMGNHAETGDLPWAVSNSWLASWYLLQIFPSLPTFLPWNKANQGLVALKKKAHTYAVSIVQQGYCNFH